MAKLFYERDVEPQLIKDLKVAILGLRKPGPRACAEPEGQRPSTCGWDCTPRARAKPRRKPTA